MTLAIRFILLVINVSSLVCAAQEPADVTIRVCFGRLHPECVLLEERDTNGKREYVLASTKRGQVAEERTLTLHQRDGLMRAIQNFQSVAGPENQVCSSLVKFEQFNLEQLIETESFCARRSQSEALRSKLISGLLSD